MFENFYNINVGFNCWLNYMSSQLDCRNRKGKEHVCLVPCFIPMAVIWYMLNKYIIKEEQVRPCQMRRAFRPGVAEAVGALPYPSLPIIPMHADSFQL